MRHLLPRKKKKLKPVIKHQNEQYFSRSNLNNIWECEFETGKKINFKIQINNSNDKKVHLSYLTLCMSKVFKA